MRTPEAAPGAPGHHFGSVFDDLGTILDTFCSKIGFCTKNDFLVTLTEKVTFCSQSELLAIPGPKMLQIRQGL